MNAWRILQIVALRDGPFWTASWPRRFLRLVVFCLYLYLGALVMLLWLENRFLFAGAAYSENLPAPADLTVEDLFLNSADGNRLHAWWIRPPGWQPEQGAILFSHGNGGDLTIRQDWARLWQRYLGRAVLLYDYPGYGTSTGSPTEANCYAAAEAAHRWLVEQARVPEKEIILVGESLGGAMSIELATRHPCRMLVTAATFTSFPDMAAHMFPWLPGRWLVRNQLDNLGKISKVNCPVFIMHGRADRLVPFRQAERLFAAAQEPKRFYPMDDQPHLHPDQAAFYLAVREFLAETETKSK